MAKQIIVSSRDEDGRSLSIVAKVETPGLTLSEQWRVRKELGRLLSDAIRSLLWTDFGPENTKVTF